MQKDNTLKQKYLLQEIIQKNYDPEQFQQLLMAEKKGGDDLDNWSMQELEEIVMRFQRKYNKASIHDESQLNQAELKASLHEEQIEKKQLVENVMIDNQKKGGYLEFNYEGNHESFSEVVNCQVVPPNSLLTHDVTVKMLKFEKKEGGLFEQSYVSYFISTPFLNKVVERRYSDFQWLKSTLQALHPGLPIPPIAKKGQFRRYDDKHLNKRMMILEMFLNKLLQIPETRAEQVLENFLKFDDRVTFQKFRSNYKKTGALIPIHKIQNTKGKITLGFDPKINSFLVKSQKYFVESQPDIKRIYKQFKMAATTLQATSDVLTGISNLCNELDAKEQSFRKDAEIFYCKNNIFTMLSETTSRLAEQITNQATLLRTNMYATIKYESLYMLNIMDSFDSLATFQKSYQDKKNELMKKKQKLFEEGNVSKWNLKDSSIDKSNKEQAIKKMLPEQTNKLGGLREVYAMFNFHMFQELNRYFSTKNYQLGKCLQPMCRNQTKICSQMMMIWVDMETNILGMKENKFIQKC